MRFLIVVLIFAVFSLTAPSVHASGGAIAVVVSDSNKTTDLSMTQLKRLYLGKTTAFPNDKPVTMFEYTPLVKDFYKLVSAMTIQEFRMHWIKQVFSGTNAAPPAKCSDVENIKKILCNDSSAVCFIRYSEVQDCMKVVKIDGKSPLDKDYPLQETKPSK